jgi:hypothetical protein
MVSTSPQRTVTDCPKPSETSTSQALAPCFRHGENVARQFLQRVEAVAEARFAERRWWLDGTWGGGQRQKPLS